MVPITGLYSKKSIMNAGFAGLTRAVGGVVLNMCWAIPVKPRFYCLTHVSPKWVGLTWINMCFSEPCMNEWNHIRFRGRQEISTFSTYEITSHKRGEGVAKMCNRSMVLYLNRGSKSYETLSHKWKM